MSESFSVISNIAITAYSGRLFQSIFFKWIFESKQVTKSASWSRNNITLQNGILFLMVCLKRPLKSREDLLQLAH